MAKQAHLSPVQQKEKKRETRQRRAASTRHKLVKSSHSDKELAELRTAARIDMLLDTQYYERQQIAEDEEDEPATKKKKTTERRRRPKNVAQVLLDDFLGVEPTEDDWVSVAVGPSTRFPQQKACVVTGKRNAQYADPLTGCRYYDAAAFAEIRENPPSWVKLTGVVHGAPYFEAMKQIQKERLSSC